jgi:hypothetical protein
VVQRYLPKDFKWEISVSYKFAPNKALELHVSVWKGDYHAIEALYRATFYIYTVSCMNPFYKLIKEEYLYLL